MDNLRHYEKDFPDYCDYPQKELETCTVNVKDIIGGNPFASKNYFSDWTPKDIEKGIRYEGVEKFVKFRMKESKHHYPLDLGYIHLFKIYCNSLKKDIYYVCGDGHRRISVCHRFKIKSVLAKVTLLII